MKYQCPNCHHNFNAKKINFCPTCGLQVKRNDDINDNPSPKRKKVFQIIYLILNIFIWVMGIIMAYSLLKLGRISDATSQTGDPGEAIGLGTAMVLVLVLGLAGLIVLFIPAIIIVIINIINLCRGKTRVYKNLSIINLVLSSTFIIFELIIVLITYLSNQ